MHFLLKNSLFREVHFSRKVHFSFAQFFVVVIEDDNTYLDVFVRFKGFAGGNIYQEKVGFCYTYITPLVFFKTIIFLKISTYLHLINSTTVTQYCSMEKCEDFSHISNN